MNQKYKHIISLGKLCLPRMIIDKFRPKFPIRMPFDGSYHQYDFMCEMLETNFKDYLKDCFLQKLSETKSIWSKKKAYWNHESTEDLSALEKNCADRIAQFNQTLSSGDSIMFLYWDDDKEHSKKIEKVAKIIKNRWPDLKYHVTHYNSMAPEEKIISLENCTYLGKPFPKEKGSANGGILIQENHDYLKDFVSSFCKILEEDPKSNDGLVRRNLV